MKTIISILAIVGLLFLMPDTSFAAACKAGKCERDCHAKKCWCVSYKNGNCACGCTNPLESPDELLNRTDKMNVSFGEATMTYDAIKVLNTNLKDPISYPDENKEIGEYKKDDVTVQSIIDDMGLEPSVQKGGFGSTGFGIIGGVITGLLAIGLTVVMLRKRSVA